ncbi:hypothetical protein DFH06DRAFT_1349727 [Mycena polygramma]|nr:hypothetical protein DFH06DRAFT_1349727 [Mycena polygramma]
MGSGKKLAPSRKPKKRSQAKKASEKANLTWNKENITAPAASSSSSTPRRVKPARNYKVDYANSRRQVLHLQAAKQKLKTEVNNLTEAQKGLRDEREAADVRATFLAGQLASQQEDAAEGAARSEATHQSLRAAQDILRGKNRAMAKRLDRAAGVMARTVARIEKKPGVSKVTRSGIYTSQTRRLARTMVQSGCARGKVGPLMSEIASVFGVKISRKMSRRTVSRAILEGGVAASMQMTYEIGLNTGNYLRYFLASLNLTKIIPGLTISADSTSNRGNNYEATKIAMRVPHYASGRVDVDPISIPKIRDSGIKSTVDHGSARSVEGWKQTISESMALFNASPLAARLDKRYNLRHFLRVLMGMNGDHASTEKGAARGMEELKKEAVIEELGEDALLQKDMHELVLYLAAWNAKKLASVGGIEAYNRLSPKEQAELDENLMKEIITSLGKKEFDALSEEERRPLTLFLWGGCCMHKHLNSFKGGNAEMMLEHTRRGLIPPIILANKHNTVQLKRWLEPGTKVPDTLTPDEQLAFESSTRGGVKTCAIAGAICNNKDDKIGQGDRHVEFFTAKIGKTHCRFPDTSNTRFGTYGLAAAELIKYLDLYLEFLDVIEYTKATISLTNIEVNLRRALKDTPTLVELCAMVLYSQIISHPYLRVVRGPGTSQTNLLDLGPLHIEVRAHIERILEDPELLFGSDMSFATAAMDAQPWEDPKAVDAVVKLLATLPDHRKIVLAFFRGALATWIRFSAELAPGGLIDLASAEERLAA